MKAGERTAPSGFRPDVEGLRAIAIAAVLLCHAGLPVAAGGYVGVDVFFVISGFLITRLLLGELEATGSVSLREFYARRVRRLLPSLVVLLAVVAVLTFVLLTPLRGTEVSADIVSSAFYVVNWHFSAQAVDYFAQGGEPSPVQHLWSLAVEEQFYLVWPALLLLVTWVWRRRGRRVAPLLWAIVAVVGLASLAFGLQLTQAEPSAAYFSTLGRAWELALGAALAALGPIRLPAALRAGLAWAGLSAIVAAILLFDAATPFPGLAALAPTLGAAAIILAGTAATAPGPSRLLVLRPVRYVGRVSYSWSLWHWPAVIFATVLWGPLGILAGLAVTLASLLPAVLNHHLVERPIQHSQTLSLWPGRSLALGAGCTAAAALAGFLLLSAQPQLRTAPLSEVEGARALPSQPFPQERVEAVRPNPLQARDDRSRMYEDGCLVGVGGTRSHPCIYGDSSSTKTVFLFGDSHAMQYFPAVEELARKHGWRLVALAKAECTPAAVRIRDHAGRVYGECEAWREATLRRIESAPRSSLVLVSSASDYAPLDAKDEPLAGPERALALRTGYEQTLRQLHEAGMRTAVIKDPPPAAEDVPSCVSAQPQDLDACAFRRPRGEDYEVDAQAAHEAPGAKLVDVTAEICPHDLCRAVIGNALVYRDRNHLSATFALTLAPGIERGLRQAKLV
ncbi:MAG TPA: acyltransferase family protein [Solirubrobacterales bacterium]|nr:acyltransferase family protein [Solirubrobacterales bacterium]